MLNIGFQLGGTTLQRGYTGDLPAGLVTYMGEPVTYLGEYLIYSETLTYLGTELTYGGTTLTYRT